MKRLIVLIIVAAFMCSLFSFQNTAAAPDPIEYKIKLVDKNPNPTTMYKPRPYKNETNVPLRTSFYIELTVDGDASDSVDINTIEIQLQPDNGEPYFILNKNQEFPDGYHGIIKSGSPASIYIDSEYELMPDCVYTIKVNALTNKGHGISQKEGTWSFTTTSKATTYQLNSTLDFSKNPDVTWHGRYFNGILKPDFDTYEIYSIERYEYLYSNKVREEFPNAWTLFRDFSLTGFGHFDNSLLDPRYPNVVREKETRHIISMERTAEGVLLHVEDFFGHEQYGVESNRPVSEDYKAGNEILISDGTNHTRAFVISANDKDSTVLVSEFADPPGGWQLDYFKPLPTEPEPYTPGLFSKGGTYLIKYNPVGTPVYYWERLHHAWDRLHFEYGQRIALNFNQAPGDLSITGGVWTTAKDMVQLHKVTYDITCHIIDRYGDATLDWVWSVFNEPDLWSAFWRNNDWIELQRFYDYTSDAILKAFEDKGYDSKDVFIGGLELGAIFGTNLKLHDFLSHCSPTADKYGSNTLEYNAAYADPRLDGKRSKRVEELCSANNGKGAPLDFISIHTYNSADIGAAKIIKAKEIALEIDPEYYSDLWINNFESVPTWSGFDDPGASEWSLGNGYFQTWAADYFGRMLQKAAEDPRYSYGEGVITLWGFPQRNFEFLNDVVTIVKVREGREIRDEVIPKPIFHYVNLLSTMDTNYWVLPYEQIAGHTVSGFAAPGDDDLRLVLYSHGRYDAQSRADYNFNYKINLKGLEWNKVTITEYQLDKENNTLYPFAMKYINKNTLTAKEYQTLLEMSELKATNERTYEVNTGGSLDVEFPIAANGVNFIVISEAKDEVTPPETPEETPSDTTPPETPGETPPETPGETPQETSGETPEESPDSSPVETPADTPVDTPASTPDESPAQPDETEGQSGDNGKDRSPDTNDKYNIAFVMLLSLLSGIVAILAVKRIKKT